MAGDGQPTAALWSLYSGPFFKGFISFWVFFLTLICVFDSPSPFLSGSYPAFVRTLRPHAGEEEREEQQHQQTLQKPFFILFLFFAAASLVLAFHTIELSYRPTLKRVLRECYLRPLRGLSSSSSSCNIPPLKPLLQWLLNKEEAGVIEDTRRVSFPELKALHSHCGSNLQWLYLRGEARRRMLSRHPSLQGISLPPPIRRIHSTPNLLQQQQQQQQEHAAAAAGLGPPPPLPQQLRLAGSSLAGKVHPLHACYSVPCGLDKQGTEEYRIISRKSSFDEDEQKADASEAAAAAAAAAEAAAAVNLGRVSWWCRWLRALGFRRRQHKEAAQDRRRQAQRMGRGGPIGDTELVWAVNSAALRAAPNWGDRLVHLFLLWLPELLLLCVCLPLWCSALAQSPPTSTANRHWEILTVWGCLLSFCFLLTLAWDFVRALTPLARIARTLIIYRERKAKGPAGGVPGGARPAPICCACMQRCRPGDLVFKPPTMHDPEAAAAAAAAAARPPPLDLPEIPTVLPWEQNAAAEPAAAAANAAAAGEAAADKPAAPAAAHAPGAPAADNASLPALLGPEEAAAAAAGERPKAAAATEAAAAPGGDDPLKAAEAGGCSGECHHSVHLGCFFSQAVPWCQKCRTPFSVAPLPLAFNLAAVIFLTFLAIYRLPWQAREMRADVAAWWADLRERKRQEREAQRRPARGGGGPPRAPGAPPVGPRAPSQHPPNHAASHTRTARVRVPLHEQKEAARGRIAAMLKRREDEDNAAAAAGAGAPAAAGDPAAAAASAAAGSPAAAQAADPAASSPPASVKAEGERDEAPRAKLDKLDVHSNFCSLLFVGLRLSPLFLLTLIRAKEQTQRRLQQQQTNQRERRTAASCTPFPPSKPASSPSALSSSRPPEAKKLEKGEKNKLVSNKDQY
ncbi:hypothetical protein Efla_006192 [Eimeria flavescens]